MPILHEPKRYAMWAAAYSLVMPGGMILIAVYACTQWFELPDPISDFLRGVPSALLAAGTLIGGRFRRSQLALGCVVLLLFDGSLMLAASPSLQAVRGARVAFSALAVLVPLNFLLLSLAEDRGKRPSQNESVLVTVSIGVAESEGPKADPAEVTRAADAALYQAKDGGRNQVRS